LCTIKYSHFRLCFRMFKFSKLAFSWNVNDPINRRLFLFHMKIINVLVVILSIFIVCAEAQLGSFNVSSLKTDNSSVRAVAGSDDFIFACLTNVPNRIFYWDRQKKIMNSLNPNLNNNELCAFLEISEDNTILVGAFVSGVSGTSTITSWRIISKQLMMLKSMQLSREITAMKTARNQIFLGSRSNQVIAYQIPYLDVQTFTWNFTIGYPSPYLQDIVIRNSDLYFGFLFKFDSKVLVVSYSLDSNKEAIYKPATYLYIPLSAVRLHLAVFMDKMFATLNYDFLGRTSSFTWNISDVSQVEDLIYADTEFPVDITTTKFHYISTMCNSIISPILSCNLTIRDIKNTTSIIFPLFSSLSMSPFFSNNINVRHLESIEVFFIVLS
jgi:hypothetical protein